MTQTSKPAAQQQTCDRVRGAVDKTENLRYDSIDCTRDDANGVIGKNGNSLIQGGVTAPLASSRRNPFKRSKFLNVWTEYNGRKYQSKAEARRAAELDTMLQHGVILSWTPQPKYTLGCPENVYRADFEVVYADGTVEAQDVKGMRTRMFNHHVKLWRAYGPHTLAILSARARGWKVEYIPGKSGMPNNCQPMPREQGFVLAEKKKKKRTKEEDLV